MQFGWDKIMLEPEYADVLEEVKSNLVTMYSKVLKQALLKTPSEFGYMIGYDPASKFGIQVNPDLDYTLEFGLYAILIDNDQVLSYFRIAFNKNNTYIGTVYQSTIKSNLDGSDFIDDSIDNGLWDKYQQAKQVWKKQFDEKTAKAISIDKLQSTTELIEIHDKSIEEIQSQLEKDIEPIKKDQSKSIAISNKKYITELIDIDKLRRYNLTAIKAYDIEFRTFGYKSVTTYCSLSAKALKEGKIYEIYSDYKGIILYEECSRTYKYKKKDSTNLVKLADTYLYVYYDRLAKSVSKVPIDMFELDKATKQIYERKQAFRNNYYNQYKKRKNNILEIDISKIKLDVYTVKFFQTLLTAFKSLDDAVLYMCTNFEIDDDIIQKDNAVELLTNKFDECLALLYNFKHITNENRTSVAHYVEDLNLYSKMNTIFKEEDIIPIAALAGKKTAKYVFKKAKLSPKQKQELMCYTETIKLYATPKTDQDINDIQMNLLSLQEEYNDDSDGCILLDIKIEGDKLAYYFYTYEDGTKIDGQRLSWLTNLYNQKNKGKKPELLLEYQEV